VSRYNLLPAPPDRDHEGPAVALYDGEAVLAIYTEAETDTALDRLNALREIEAES
jgi:hypothetical protein